MKEMIKNEILKRYEILFGQGLAAEAKDWVRDGKVLISNTLPDWNLSGEIESWGVLFTLDEKPEYTPYVEKIESERNIKVYMGIVTHTTVGTLLSLMFVPEEESGWERERDFMKEEQIHYAFVFHIEEEYYELGSIQYEVTGGGLVRSE